MYVNLHTLPYDQSMYTLHIAETDYTDINETCLEEIDIVAGHRANATEIVDAARAELTKWYEHGIVVGIVNQSDGYIMYDADAGHVRGIEF